MAKMKKEADVKAAVKQILTELGPSAWWFMPVPTGFGVQGVPDFVCSVAGRFVGIETKFGDNELTKWQLKQMQGIMGSGAAYFIVTEHSVHELKNTLAAILALEES